MQQVTKEQLQKDNYLLYIFTPFCGTCHVARGMLKKIEAMQRQEIFIEMNASFYPDFMQNYQIQSVPCLLIKKDGEIMEKIYAFKNIANIYHYLIMYRPEIFTHKK